MHRKARLSYGWIFIIFPWFTQIKILKFLLLKKEIIPNVLNISEPYVLPERVKIKNSFDKIPNYSLFSIHEPDLSLEKQEYPHIRFFNKNAFHGVKGYAPREPNNMAFIGPYYDGLQEDLCRQCYDYHATYAHLIDMYVTFTSVYCTKYFEFINLEKYYNFMEIRKYHDGKVIGYYPHVITVGNFNTYGFGHFFYDCLAPLLMFPQELIDMSYIAVNGKTEVYKIFYKALGLSLDKIIFIPSPRWVYCSNLYTPLNPLPHMTHYGKLTKTLSEKLRKAFNLDQIQPTKYFCVNRNNHTLPRYINNMKEIVEAANKKYPERNFLYLQDIDDFNQSAKEWATAKFVFSPNGSLLSKNLYMKEKGVLVVIIGSYTDNCIPLSACSHDVYTLHFRLPGMGQRVCTENIIDIELAMRVIGIGLYCVDNGHFNPNESFI